MKLVLVPATLALLALLATDSDSILPNGDFSQADPSNPNKAAHWEAVDGLGVAWTDAPAIPGEPAGKAIRMNPDVSEPDMDASYTKAGLLKWLIPHPQAESVGYLVGLSLYSDPLPVQPGKVYHVSFDYMSGKLPNGKLFFRGYKIQNGQEVLRYESLVNCTGIGDKWIHCKGTFHPTRHTPEVTEFKIMLYGYDYYPPPGGLIWWRNVKVTMEDDPDAPPPDAPDTSRDAGTNLPPVIPTTSNTSYPPTNAVP